MKTIVKNNIILFKILCLAAFIVSGLFVLDSKGNFNLWDEGYVWYGAQRVMLGEVPIRDFMSYDPGRYYWSAAFMRLWNDNSFMALSGAATLFEMIGFFVSLLLIARSTEKQNGCYLLLSAVTLAVWMYQVLRSYDVTVSILLISALTFLIQNPTNKRYLFAGLAVGLAAFFGRQHGVYGVAGSIGVMLWLAINQEERSGLVKGVMYWMAGIILGYLPMILMMLFIPGFFISFWDALFNTYTGLFAAIASDIPWPWLVPVSSLSLGDAIRELLIGLFYVAVFIFGVVFIFWVSWQRYKNKHIPLVFVASSFLILPYSHYTTLLTGATHLSLGIFPLLIAFLVFLNSQSPRIKWSLSVILFAASFWVMYIYHASGHCFSTGQCVEIKVSGSNYVTNPDTVRQVKLIRRLANKYASNGQSFIVAPFYPGAYPLLERKSPILEIFPDYSRNEAFERTEIERIKSAKPAFVYLHDFFLGDKKEKATRFKYTHPLTYQYIEDNFDRFPGLPNPLYRIYIAKGNIASETKAQSVEQSDDTFMTLKILNWMPQSSIQGVIPNLQPDGSAKIVIKVTGDEKLVADGTVQVLFDGKPADLTTVNPGEITASVAANQFNSLGKKEVSIRQAFTKNKFSIGDFNIEAKE